MKRVLFVLFVLSALFSILACSPRSLGEAGGSSAPAPTNVGQAEIQQATRKMAPDFTLDGFQANSPTDSGDVSYGDLEGVSLSDYRGKVVLLNFWEDTCPPCLMETLTMERLYERFADKDFVILAVEIGQLGSAENVKKYVEGAELTFPILFDDGRVASLYGVTSIPTSFLIGPDGDIKEDKFVGARHWGSPWGEDLVKKYSPKTELQYKKED